MLSHISFEHTIHYYYGTDYMRFGISIDEDIQVSKGMFVAPTMHVVEVEVLVEVRSSKVAQKVKKKTLVVEVPLWMIICLACL